MANGTATSYAQDLAAPLSQVLQTKQGSTTINYLYGRERLASLAGSTRTWYAADALGSVRRTLTDSGIPNPPIAYDPWGTVESGTVPTFGFTGELQDSATGLVNLRARWYHTGHGTFTSRDSFPGFPEQPYSLHSYQYGFSDPVLNGDPSGRFCIPIPWTNIQVGTTCDGGGGSWGDEGNAEAGGVVVNPPPIGVDAPEVANPPNPLGNVSPPGPMTMPEIAPAAPAAPAVAAGAGAGAAEAGGAVVGGPPVWMLVVLAACASLLGGDAPIPQTRPQPQPQPTPAPTYVPSPTPTPTPCTKSTYDYGDLEQFDPNNPARKRARWAQATLCQPLGKGTQFKGGRNGTLIEGRGGAFPDRGHLIAKELGGQGRRENGVPMAPASNQYGSRMRTIEERVKAAVLQGIPYGMR